MHVERDFFASGRPMFVTETVDVFAVKTGVEGVVTGGDSALVDLVGAGWVLDLYDEGYVSQGAFSKTSSHTGAL